MPLNQMWNFSLFQLHAFDSESEYSCAQGSEYEVGGTAPDHDLGAVEQGFVCYIGSYFGSFMRCHRRIELCPYRWPAHTLDTSLFALANGMLSLMICVCEHVSLFGPWLSAGRNYSCESVFACGG